VRVKGFVGGRKDENGNKIWEVLIRAISFRAFLLVFISCLSIQFIFQLGHVPEVLSTF